MREEDVKDKGLYQRLSEYCAGDFYPYHMPGHKRGRYAGDMARYFGIDITEIDGFDDLYHANGVLRDAQERANRLYGAEETYYLVNGSTVGVLASVMAAAKRGEEILIARNCHRSVYHAAILQELKPHYYYPEILDEYGIWDGVGADGINRLLEQYPACRTVVITSPTYEGIVSDVSAVAKSVHRHGGVLIVDEAHGAHFGLDDHMPQSAVMCGADLVVHSLHKTLPSMTQTALLHVKGERADRRKLREYLRMMQTSSPSYVMMASMDCCVRYLEEHGAQRFAFMKRQYDLFRRQTETLKHIRIGSMTHMSEKGYHLTDWDMGKLVISVRNTSLTGPMLYRILREEYHLQMEMSGADYVVAIMTIMDTHDGWQRLADALRRIDDRIEGEEFDGAAGTASLPEKTGPFTPAEIVMTPADAFCADRREVPLEQAAGKTAAEFVNLYPPGIPLLVPGERVSTDILAKIRKYLQAGLCVQGVTPDAEIAVVL